MSWFDRVLGRSAHPNVLLLPGQGGTPRRELLAPVLARQALVPDQMLAKATRQFPVGTPRRQPRSRFFDPMGLMYSLGYKDRRYSLTYDTLRRVTYQLGIVGAVINTRCSQVAQFAQPYRNTRTLGFEIRHKDPDRKMTRGERAFARDLETFTMQAGAGENRHTRVPRPDFEGLLRQTVRDTLTFDQVAWEITPDTRGRPFEVRGVDASSIRIAADDEPDSPLRSQLKKYGQEDYSPRVKERYGLVTRPRFGPKPHNEDVDYVQVVNGRIENLYNRDEMLFLVRNPRTDLFVNGYGFAEVEQLILSVTAMLHAEEFNRRFFMQGAAPKGMINIKGENVAPEQIEAFKRQWQAQVAGVENAWRTPVLQSEGMEYVNLHQNHRDSEYMAWLEYLIKIVCAVFLIDPAECNFDMHGGVSQTPLFESANEQKLKESRDKGLRPQLRFIAKGWNKVIDKIDDHFYMEFVGLDELSELDKLDVSVRELQSFKTINEVRQERDLPPIEDGDIVLSPVYLQAQQQRQMAEQQQQMGAMGGGPEEAGGAPPEGGEEQVPWGGDTTPLAQQGQAFDEQPQAAMAAKSARVVHLLLDERSP